MQRSRIATSLPQPDAQAGQRREPLQHELFHAKERLLRLIEECVEQFEAVSTSAEWRERTQGAGELVVGLQQLRPEVVSRFGAHADPSRVVESVAAFMEAELRSVPNHPFRRAFEALFSALTLMDAAKALPSGTDMVQVNVSVSRSFERLTSNYRALFAMLYYLSILKGTGELYGVTFEAATSLFIRWSLFSALEVHPAGIDQSFIEVLGHQMFERPGDGPFINKFGHTASIQPGDTLRDLIRKRWVRFGERPPHPEESILQGLYQANPALVNLPLDADLFRAGITTIVWRPPIAANYDYAHSGVERRIREVDLRTGQRKPTHESREPDAERTGHNQLARALPLEDNPREESRPGTSRFVAFDGPVEQMNAFGKRLSEEIEVQRTSLRQLLGQLAGRDLETNEQRQAIVGTINEALDRLGLRFFLGDGYLYRLRASPNASGRVSIQFQAGGGRTRLGASGLPEAALWTLVPAP